MSNQPIGFNVPDSDTRQSLTTQSTGGHIKLEISLSDRTTFDLVKARLEHALSNLGANAHFQLTTELNTITKFDNDLF